MSAEIEETCGRCGKQVRFVASRDGHSCPACGTGRYTVGGCWRRAVFQIGHGGGWVALLAYGFIYLRETEARTAVLWVVGGGAAIACVVVLLGVRNVVRALRRKRCNPTIKFTLTIGI